MFKGIVIGNLGSDAEIRTANGRKFVSFRVAHNDRYTDQQGQEHNETTWVDCVISNAEHAVVPYLKAGTNVYVEGRQSLRIYSSPKLRQMVPSATINVQHIELIGGKSDIVPSRLWDSNGVQHDITKWYYVADARNCQLMNIRGRQFSVSPDGWVTPLPENYVQQVATTDAPQQNAASTPADDQQNLATDDNGEPIKNF